MKVTDEMVMAAINHKYGIELVPDDRMKDKMRALLHSACHAMPKQEPVCYVDQPSERLIDWNTELFHFSFELPEEGTPLYTNPQPQREPLNAHEIKQLLKRDDGLNVTDLVRAVEKAHGIGV